MGSPIDRRPGSSARGSTSTHAPWTKLVAPELTDALIDKVADGCADQAAGRSIRELEARRDEFLVELLALVQKCWPEAEGRPGWL
jgi:carnitine 3-dehydrogenase